MGTRRPASPTRIGDAPQSVTRLDCDCREPRTGRTGLLRGFSVFSPLIRPCPRAAEPGVHAYVGVASDRVSCDTDHWRATGPRTMPPQGRPVRLDRIAPA